jgi:RNA polymerase sigma-70 factor (ECF subfamily)
VGDHKARIRRRIANDDDLIRLVAGGDTAAFAELTRRHRQWVHRLLLSFTRDADQAEDLTQEAFTRALRFAGSYHGRGAFVAWLRRIAINTGNLHAQRRGQLALVPLAEVGEGVATAGDGADPVFVVLAGSLQADIRAALTALPVDQRDAIVLRYFGGLTVLEIARAQRCPEGTVKSRIHHGLRRVRETLAEAWGPAADGEGTDRR